MISYKAEQLFAQVEAGKIQGFLLVDKTDIKLPFTLIQGKKEGKTLLITAGLHGAEYVGIEASKELAGRLEAEEVAGRIIIIHTLNVSGFRERLAGVTAEDGLNLNRIFPADGAGNTSEKLAYFVLEKLSSQADFYIDMHGGDLHGSISPLIFYPTDCDQLTSKVAFEAARASGFPSLVASVSVNGSYGSAAKRGVPALLTELGGRGLWTQEEVASYRDKILNIMIHLGYVEKKDKASLEGALSAAYPTSKINYFKPVEEINSSAEGFWYPNFASGDWVRKGQTLGQIRDVFDCPLEDIFSPEDGMILYQTVALSIKRDSFLTAIAPLNIEVRKIKPDEVALTQEFVFRTIKKLFNSDKNPLYHKDLINMQEIYLDKEDNAFFGAFTKENQLVGTMGIMEFDLRFPAVQGLYDGIKIAELGRSYIDQDLRRRGIGSLLYDQAEKFCRERNYQKIYLHTHRHLPGGFDFWLKKDFIIAVEDNDPNKTVHMEKNLRGEKDE